MLQEQRCDVTAGKADLERVVSPYVLRIAHADKVVYRLSADVPWLYPVIQSEPDC